MRVFLPLILIFASMSAQAIDDLNHLSCMEIKTGGDTNSWNYSYQNNFSLKPGETRTLNTYWSSVESEKVNRAFCAVMLGTQDPDSVEIDLIAYKGASFEGFEDESSCIPWGRQIELESKRTFKVSRGQFAELKLKWIPANKGEIILREYFPRKDELADLQNKSDEICQRIMSQK